MASSRLPPTGAERIRPRDDDEVRVVLVSRVDGARYFPIASSRLTIVFPAM